MTKILQALTWTPGEVKTSFQKKKKEREKREKKNKREFRCIWTRNEIHIQMIVRFTTKYTMEAP